MFPERSKDTNDVKKLSELVIGDSRINVIAVTYSCSIVTCTKGKLTSMFVLIATIINVQPVQQRLSFLRKEDNYCELRCI